jgi:hypothetical protein
MVFDQLEEVLGLVLGIDSNNPNSRHHLCAPGNPIVWTTFGMVPASVTLSY